MLFLERSFVTGVIASRDTLLNLLCLTHKLQIISASVMLSDEYTAFLKLGCEFVKQLY